MDQTPSAEEEKSQVEKTASAAGFPLWLVTSLALGLASLITLVYYFFVKRVKTPVFPSQPHESEQAGEVEHGLDIIKRKPAFANPAKQDSSEARFELSEDWTLPVTWEKVKPAILPLFALVIAYFAQGVFDSTNGNGLLRNVAWLAALSVENRLWLGSGLYVISGLIWAFTTPPLRVLGLVSSHPSTQKVPAQRPTPLRLFLLLTSAGAYFVSILNFLISGENAFVRIVWGVGLASFILAQVLNKDTHPEAEESPHFGWQNWLVLILILAVSFWLRYYRLAILPDDFHGDMASHGMIARDYLLGVEKNIFINGYMTIPIMGFLPAAFTMAVFGNNIFGLQMSSVLAGTFMLLAVYLLVWRLFDNHRLAAFTMILTAINVLHIHFSRIAQHMEPWFFGCFALFLLVDGLKARRRLSFGLAGVFLGLGMQMYFSGRVLLFIIPLFLVYAFFFQRSWFIQNKRGLVTMAAGILLAMGPSLAFNLLSLEDYILRTQQLFLFSPGSLAHMLYKYNTDSPLVVLLTQIKLSLLMFHYTGDSSSHVGYPYTMFHSLVSPLIVLGLGAALRRWKNAGLFLALIWLGLMIALGSILLVDAPAWTHLVGIVPAAALLIAVSLEQIFEIFKKYLGARSVSYLIPLVVAFLMLVGYVNWNQYYETVKDNASPTTRLGRYIGSLPLDVTTCGILNIPELTVRETAFLAWPHKLVDIAPDAPDSELETCTGSSILWVLSPETVGHLDAIRARWTDGVVETYTFPRSGYTFTFYLINVDSHPQSDIERLLQNPPLPRVEESTPEAGLPLWLVPSLIVGFVLLTALAYYFSVKRLEEVSPTQSDEMKEAVEARQGVSIETSTEQNSPSRWLNLPPLELNWEKVKPAIAPLVAVAIAYFAQGVFDSINGSGLLRNAAWLMPISADNRLWLGAGVYLASALLWASSALPLYPMALAPVLRSSSNSTASRPPYLRFPLLLTSAGAYFASILFFLINGENAFIRILWGVGLASFILAQVLNKDTHPEAEESPRFVWKNWLILGLILAAGFWLRYYRLAILPDDFHGDMASHGLLARDYLLGVEKNIFGYGFYAIPIMGFLPATFTMAVFGNNIFGLHMSSVLGGTFTLLAVYLLVWRLFDNHRLAALAMILTAINATHIHFSRIAEYMDPWTFGCFALFLFVDGLKARRIPSFGLAGVFLGFGLQMYFSGRSLIFIIALFLVYAFFFHRSWIIQNKHGLMFMAAGMLLAIGPALVSYLTGWEDYVLRSRQVFIFSEGALGHMLYKYNTDSPLVVLLTQIKYSLLMFHHSVDSSTQFGFPYPILSMLISPLMVLGLGAALRRWKESGMAFAIIGLSILTALGSILTMDAPFWPRLVGIVPFAALFVALPLEQILGIAEKIIGMRRAVFVTAMLTVFLASVGYLTWNQYYEIVKDGGSPSTFTGRYISRLPLDVTACGILNDPQLSVRETAFLVWPHKIVDIAPDAPDTELDKCVGESIVWVLSPETVGHLDAIRSRWPGGFLDEHYLPRRDYTVTFYLVGIAPLDSMPETKNHWTVPNSISVAIALIFSGVIGWLVFRSVISKKLRVRQMKGGDAPLTFFTNLQKPQTSSSDENIFAGLSRWYDEITSFTFPAITPKLIASILLPLLAVGLAYFAQTFIDQFVGFGLHLNVEALYLDSEGQRQAIAVLIFVIAALLWTFTTIGSGIEPSQGQISKSDQPLQPVMRSAVQVFGIFLTVSSMILYAVMDENALVRWLWLAGLALFLVSLIVKKQSSAVVLQEESPPFRWGQVLALFSLLALAFFLRVYRVYDIPLDLSTDMASVGISARDYLMGVEKRIFGTGWYYYPRFVFLTYTASMWLTGNNLYGMNFGTVIMGTINVLGSYLFIWRLFDRHRLALLTAVLITINPAHIHFSRIPSYVDPWSLGFLGLFFFVDGLKGRRWTSLALAGLFTGFSFASYPSGRAVLPILAIALASAWFFKRKWVTDNYVGFIWMFLGGLVALGPNLIYFIADWDVYMQRSREVIIFNPGVIDHLKYTYNVNSMWMIVWEQVKRSVLQFNYYSDRSAQFFYPYPMFNFLVSPLLILGFGMSMYRWKKPEFLLSISSFVIILVTGSILTNDAPTWCRLVGIITFAALLIALVVDEFACLMERLSLKSLIPLLLAVIALFFVQLGSVDWNTYLNYVGDINTTRPEVQVARYLDALPDEITACGVTHEYHIDQEEIRFMGFPRQIIVIPEDEEVLPSDLCPREKAVWILEPAYENRLGEIQDLSPGGIVERHHAENGWHVFTSYLLP